MAAQWRAVARVLHSHGKTGEVVARLSDNLSLHLDPTTEFWPVPPELDLPRPLHLKEGSEALSQGQEARGAKVLLRFCEIQDRSAAERLSGKALVVSLDDSEEEAGQDMLDALIGIQVFDEKLGRIGSVVDLLDNSAYLSLVLRLENSEQTGDGAKELTLPLVADYLSTKDSDPGLQEEEPYDLAYELAHRLLDNEISELRLCLPDGFIDLAN